MTIVYAIEPYAKLAPAIAGLVERHWSELAVHKDIPLNPDMEFYEKGSALGMLTLYTARDEKTDDLVGYAIFVIRKHPHYKEHSWALNDIFWVLPERRGGLIGKRLIDFVENDLKAKGIHVIHINTKTASPMLAGLLTLCGYTTVELGHEKRLN